MGLDVAVNALLVQCNRQMRPVAQDLLNGVCQTVAWTLLDKDASSVPPREIDDLRKINGLKGLPR